MYILIWIHPLLDLFEQLLEQIIGLNYRTALTKLRDANLNIRVLANRYDLPLEPGTVIAQTPQAGERVDCGTVIGVTMSGADLKRNSSLHSPDSSILSRPPKNAICFEKRRHKGFIKKLDKTAALGRLPMEN